MATRAQFPLVRVWAGAAAVFVVALFVARALSNRPTPWPAYGAGLIGLLAVGVALMLSWRRVNEPGSYKPHTQRLLRGLITIGVLLWLIAMVFPFL